MKLVFRGHDDRYAVEQSLLAFFPEERPVYQEPEPGEDNWARVDLHQGPVYATAVTEIAHGGRLGRGTSRALLRDVTDEYERERLRQKAVKLSFFKAARSITGVTPAWDPPRQAGGPSAGAGKDSRPGQPHFRGHLLRLPFPPPPGGGDRPGGPAGQGGPAPGGHLPVYRHPLLPHPLRLLQLRVPVGGKVPGADGSVFRGAVPGDHRRRPNGAGDGPAHQVLLYGRRHPHHPVRPADGPAADPPEPQLRPVRLRGILHRGRPARHHHPGKAPGAAGPRGRPHQRQSPVPGGRSAPGHRPPPHRPGH